MFNSTISIQLNSCLLEHWEKKDGGALTKLVNLEGDKTFWLMGQAFKLDDKLEKVTTFLLGWQRKSTLLLREATGQFSIHLNGYTIYNGYTRFLTTNILHEEIREPAKSKTPSTFSITVLLSHLYDNPCKPCKLAI